MLTSANSPSTKGSAAFQFSGFRLYQIARFCIVFCTEMQSVAVGWQVYEITKSPLDLGLTGLAQFLPGIFLFLVAGHVTDRFDRRKLLTLCYVGFALSSALLLFVTLNEEMLHRAGSVKPIFAILCLVGAVRSFSMPASRALLPQLVGEEQFSKRRGVELQHISGGNNFGSGARWRLVCHISWAASGVCHRDDGWVGGSGDHDAD